VHNFPVLPSAHKFLVPTDMEYMYTSITWEKNVCACDFTQCTVLGAQSLFTWKH